jgi:hypothetical protein
MNLKLEKWTATLVALGVITRESVTFAATGFDFECL